MLALKGDVFDVSSSDNYKKGADYHILAGRDATVSLAKMSLLRIYVESHDISQLTEEELLSADNWHTEFCEKYPIVGSLVYSSEVIR